MVNMGRNELRPFGDLTHLGRKDWNNWNDVSVHIKKDIVRIYQNLGHPSVQMEKLFRDAKVSDEATEPLKHFSCDACSRLKQPLARKQVAIAHAKMFNDVVSTDVNFWKLKERKSREMKTFTVTVLYIGHPASGMHIASRVLKSDITHAVEDFRARVGFVGLARRNVSEWILIVHKSARNSLIKPMDPESLWTLFLVTLTGTLESERRKTSTLTK